MLSERLKILFDLLSCSNTDVARFAGCSPSNISRLVTGNRTPKPTGRSVIRLVGGIYGYAEHEGRLSVLCEFCGVRETDRETVLPALISTLFGTEIAPGAVFPLRRPLSREARCRTFGEKLDRVMTLLDFSNARLARTVNVDDSLISRFRGGLRSPLGNERLAVRLADALFLRAVSASRLAELGELCAIPLSGLDGDSFRDWLYRNGEEQCSEIERLLESIDSVVPAPDSEPLPFPKAVVRPYYVGSAGLRDAVVRFLSEAETGEMYLYSDEPITWMTEDPAFFRLWSSLMLSCVNRGVRIRVIHNVDRGTPEMIEAIKSWLPLYMSGKIIPFSSRRPRDTRFCHTVFLQPGKACVRGFSDADAGNDRWYEFVTDRERLALIKSGFDKTLSGSAPLLRVCADPSADPFFRELPEGEGKQEFFLSTLSAATMPRSLLRRMAKRIGDPEKQKELMKVYDAQRQNLLRSLQCFTIDELIRLPTDEELFSGKVRVNFGHELFDVDLTYTPEEFSEHAAAMIELLDQEKNYHIILMPDLPFRDIRVAGTKEGLAVLRCSPPFSAFFITEPSLCRAFTDYFHILKSQYESDRMTVRRKFEQYLL